MIYADEVAFSLPSSPMSRGETHPSMEDNFRALFDAVGLELVMYDTVMRQRIGNDCLIIARGKGWQDRLSR